MYPSNLKYTREHEWVQIGDVVRIGITSYAQDALGDVVFVSLPEPGTDVSAGSPLGEVESTKSVSDVYAPVTGTVTSRNESLDSRPELVNSDPYGEGWMVEIRPSEPVTDDTLLDAEAYEKLVSAD